MSTLGGANHVDTPEEYSRSFISPDSRRTAGRLRALFYRGNTIWRRKHSSVPQSDHSLLASGGPQAHQNGRKVTEHDPRLHGRTRTLQYVHVTVAVLFATAVGFAVAAFPSPVSSLAAPDACRRELLTHSPGWTISGSWTPDGETLLVVDILHNQILRYSPLGESLGTLPDIAERTVEKFFPQVLKTQEGSDTVLELASGRIVTLDPDGFGIRTTHDIFAEAIDGRWGIRSLFLWHPAGQDLVSVSDLKDLTKPDEDKTAWKRAFVRIPLADPASFSSLHHPEAEDLNISNQEREFYRLGNPYLAALGGTGYMLRMTDPVRIYENTAGSAILQGLAGYTYGSRLPDLPPFSTFADIPAVLGAVEESSMPVGLYGWNGRLFVVTRIAGQPQARWQVTSIDPSTGIVHGTATIPLAAAHVTIVPGPKQWAFLEKSHAYGPGDQLTKSVYFVPSARFARDLPANLCE
jgi:hypothetical protein